MMAMPTFFYPSDGGSVNYKPLLAIAVLIMGLLGCVENRLSPEGGTKIPPGFNNGGPDRLVTESSEKP